VRRPVEEAIFSVAVGAVAHGGWVAWPTDLIGAAHVLHLAPRNVVRAGRVREARERLIDVVDEV
jgi:hypothetical protein